VAAACDTSTADGVTVVWLLAADDFGWFSARWLVVRLISLEEEAAVLIDSVGTRSRDGATVRKDRDEA
jgi:hypothetical protein